MTHLRLMPPSDAQRGSDSPIREEPGSGLGLYIASGIIEAHRGKIWAESAAGGAKFTFTLPLIRPLSERTSPSPPVSSP